MSRALPSINGFLRWLGQPGKRRVSLPRILTKEQKRCWLVGSETMQAEVNLSVPLTLQVLQGLALPQEGSHGWRHLRVELRNSSLCSHGAQDLFSSSQKSILLLLFCLVLLRKAHMDWCCVMLVSSPSYWGTFLSRWPQRQSSPLHTGMAYSYYFLHSFLSFLSSFLKLEDWWKIIDLKL